jgi:hypothetical protein
MHIGDQFFTFAQSYLSTILNLNILLFTVSGFLLFKINNNYCAKILLPLSIILNIVAIIFIMVSYEAFLGFLLQYNTKELMNVKESFAILEWVFILDMISLFFTIITMSYWLIKDKK